MFLEGASMGLLWVILLGVLGLVLLFASITLGVSMVISLVLALVLLPFRIFIAILKSFLRVFW